MRRVDVFTLLEDLRDVREQVSCLRKLGIDLGDIQTGYETVIDDLLELAGLSERQADFIWEITESE